MAKQNYISLAGKIQKIGSVETFASGFKKCELWLCIESGKYPNVIPVTFKKDKIGDLNGYKEGDEVTIGGFISGHIWEGDGTKPARCFLSFEGWKIAEYKAGDENKTAQEAEGVAEVMPEADDIDDMPF